MFSIPELGDIVSIEGHKMIVEDSKAFYVITRLNDKMFPVEVASLSKNKNKMAGETITHKNLVNFLKPISVKATDMINRNALNWLKETNELEPQTIVHFIGNNRELKFVIIDDKFVSNIEFEFYVPKYGLNKGRIGIELPKKIKKDVLKKIADSLTKIVKELKFLFLTS